MDIGQVKIVLEPVSIPKLSNIYTGMIRLILSGSFGNHHRNSGINLSRTNDRCMFYAAAPNALY